MNGRTRAWWAHSVVVMTTVVIGGCAAAPRPPAPIEDHNSRTGAPATLAAVPSGVTVTRGIEDRRQSMAAEPLEVPATVPDPAVPANPAVDALLGRARDALAAGDSDGADAVLQRALSIDGADPRVWHWLAESNLARGDLDQARVMAERCDSLASGRTALQADNWRLRARIEERAGSGEAAARARKRADAYLR